MPRLGTVSIPTVDHVVPSDARGIQIVGKVHVKNEVEVQGNTVYKANIILSDLTVKAGQSCHFRYAYVEDWCMSGKSARKTVFINTNDEQSDHTNFEKTMNNLC